MMRTLTRATVATAVLVAVLVGPAAPAFAHTELRSSDPRANATVTTAVSAVTLTFTGPFRAKGATVAVIGADGQNYQTGPVEVLDLTATQAVRPLPAGRTRVTWSVVAADGDTIKGAFRFTVAASAGAPALGSPTTPGPPAPTLVATLTAVATPTLAATPISRESGTPGWIWPLAAALVVVLLAVGGWMWWRRAGTTEP
jgi:hypothetical protein